MSALTLAMSDASLPDGENIAVWQGRSGRAGIVSIEAMLEEKLPELRQRHMQWTFAMGQGFGADLQCGETPSMWWTSLLYERHPRLSPQLYLIYKLSCVEIWLAEYRAKSLRLLGWDASLERALRQICAAHNIAFQCQAGPRVQKRDIRTWKERIYDAIPAPVRALLRLAIWQITFRRHFPSCQALEPLRETPGAPRLAATIATYFPNLDLQAAAKGRYRSRYWESLHEAINAQARRERPDGQHFARWLLIYFQAPGLSLRDCIALRDTFAANGRDGLSFNFLEEFITNGDICAALRRWFRLALKSLQLQRKFSQKCHTENSAFNFWPFMRRQWAESLRGWRALERCLFNRAFRRYCKLAGPQRWLLFPLENCPWERMLVEAARAVPGNGSVFGAQHSAIRPTDFRYFDDPRTFSYEPCVAFQPDIIAGNGAHACRQWLANGMPPARLAHVEALRYLYLAKCSKQQGRGRALLIVTSFFAEETDAHLALVARAMRAGLLKNWNLLLKPHPYLMPKAWLASLTAEERAQITLCAEPMAMSLAGAAFVWASNSTTAALEAAMAGLPLLVMAASGDFDLCPIQGAPDLARSATLADVEKALANPRTPQLGPDYLNLDENLSAWRKLLGLDFAPLKEDIYVPGNIDCWQRRP